MTCEEIIRSSIGPFGTIVTASIAIYAIWRTAKEARISNTHKELISCLAETLFLLNQVIDLLDDVANHVIYRSISEKDTIGTAFDRYWTQLGELSKKFRKNQSKQRLIMPRPLYELVQIVVEKVNEARQYARDAQPDENYLYPNTEELAKAVNDASTAYRKLIHVINFPPKTGQSIKVDNLFSLR